MLPQMDRAAVMLVEILPTALQELLASETDGNI